MANSKPRLSDRFHYAFDGLMARGAWALIVWHLTFALATVVLVSLFVALLGLTPVDDAGERISFVALVWTTLMHAIDPGTITGDDEAGLFRSIMMFATVAGILLVGSLVAVLVASVSARFDQLRKGSSRVLEQDHTLIVGWSRQIFTLISEISSANASRGGGCIVVYADHDKVWMEEELRSKAPNTGKTRVVVRSGDPTDPGSLDVVSPEHARSIVVLAPEEAKDDTDVVRALLAVGRTKPADGRTQHVVTEIRDPRNIAVARLTGDRRTEVLEVGDLVSKIAVQTCLQAGLSVVYEELLTFDGNEIYFLETPAALVGKSFGDALQQFSVCTLIGVRDSDGKVVLNPPIERVLVAGERVVVIAADDDQISVSSWSGGFDEAGMVATATSIAAPERTLILGWNSRVPAILSGIDSYVVAGSEVLVVSGDPTAAAIVEQLGPSLRNLSVGHQLGDVSDRRVLDLLEPRKWNHIMVLPADRIESATQADAQVLVALLHLRDVAEELRRPFSVVSEMRDARSRDLAEVAKADDFIISDRFLGLLLAQIAEQADLSAVFEDLFDPEGAEIYLRPANDYLVDSAEVEYRTLVEVGRRRGEVVVGYRSIAESKDPNKDFGVRINPPKSSRVRLSSADRVIVLAN